MEKADAQLVKSSVSPRSGNSELEGLYYFDAERQFVVLPDMVLSFMGARAKLAFLQREHVRASEQLKAGRARREYVEEIDAEIRGASAILNVVTRVLRGFPNFDWKIFETVVDGRVDLSYVYGGFVAVDDQADEPAAKMVLDNKGSVGVYLSAMLFNPSRDFWASHSEVHALAGSNLGFGFDIRGGKVDPASVGSVKAFVEYNVREVFKSGVSSLIDEQIARLQNLLSEGEGAVVVPAECFEKITYAHIIPGYPDVIALAERFRQKTGLVIERDKLVDLSGVDERAGFYAPWAFAARKHRSSKERIQELGVVGGSGEKEVGDVAGGIGSLSYEGVMTLLKELNPGVRFGSGVELN